MHRPGLAAVVVGALALVSAQPARADNAIAVSGGRLTVEVASGGGIASVRFADGREWKLGGRSLLTEGADGAADACSPSGGAVGTDDGGARWETTCTDQSGHQTTVSDELSPAADSVAWTVHVTSQYDTYAKGIWTKLTGFSDDHTRQFWTPWGESPYVRGQNPTWSDPLRPAPFSDLDLPYGGHAEVTPPQNGQNGFSLPLATIVEPDTDHALSLIQSPADVLLDARMKTTAGGDVQFGRFNNRLVPGRPVTFHMNLVASAADWRGGLGWMASHYRDYFDSSEPALNEELSGLGSYSYYPGPFGDSLRSTLHAMDYKTNWEESLHGPYMGEFMPPVSSADQPFDSFTHVQYPDAPPTTSVNELRELLGRYTDAGFRELGYFNTTEFGAFIQYPRPPQTRPCNDPQLWASANDYLYCEFADAMMRSYDGNPTFSWEGAVVMDPGTPSYQRHLLEQAKLLLTKVPYSGIDIDRLDWIQSYNIHADDGVSWFNGAPARSLITSWKQLISKLAPLLHGMNKVLWVSPTDSKRIDWMKGVDGFLSEFNNGGTATNLDAFLGLDKPVEGWNYSLGDDPDEFLQRFLYMGVYPMSDSPVNDHGIPNSPTVERYYKDYGPMFHALRGKQWYLTPHAVTVTGGNALANAFLVPHGVVVPVVDGGKDTSAQITLRGLAQAKPGLDLSQAEYIQPGKTQWRSLATDRGPAGTVTLTVPLLRGGAMVRLSTDRDARPDSEPVTMDLTSSGDWVTQAQPGAITATVTNNTRQALTNLAGSLSEPDGWTVSPTATPGRELDPGQSARFTWRVSAPDSASATVRELRARVSYRGEAGDEQVTDARRLAAGTPVPRQEITADATSAESGHPASDTVDGNGASFWQTSQAQEFRPAITLDLGTRRNLAGLTYLPRQDGLLTGMTMRYNVYVSSDGAAFKLAGSGTWTYDTGLRSAMFTAADVRYVRLETVQGVGGPGSAAEINVVEAPHGYPLLSPASPNPLVLSPGGSAQLGTTMTNSGSTQATDVSAKLNVPQGWSATPIVAAPSSLGSGETAPLSWRITAPSSAAAGTYQAKVIVTYHEGGEAWTGTATALVVVGTPGVVPQPLMSATATSWQPGWPPSGAIDGDPNTLWHTEWVPVQAFPPQSITLDLGGTYNVYGLRYLPRQDGYINGNITSYRIYVSRDGNAFDEVADGTWPVDASEKTAGFDADAIRYVRLEGVEGGNDFVSAAEINVLGDATG